MWRRKAKPPPSTRPSSPPRRSQQRGCAPDLRQSLGAWGGGRECLALLLGRTWAVPCGPGSSCHSTVGSTSLRLCLMLFFEQAAQPFGVTEQRGPADTVPSSLLGRGPHGRRQMSFPLGARASRSWVSVAASPRCRVDGLMPKYALHLHRPSPARFFAGAAVTQRRPGGRNAGNSSSRGLGAGSLRSRCRQAVSSPCLHITHLPPCVRLCPRLSF